MLDMDGMLDNPDMDVLVHHHHVDMVAASLFHSPALCRFPRMVT